MSLKRKDPLDICVLYVLFSTGMFKGARLKTIQQK